ncbi:MAG: FGGY family carbohydrate kinase [Granulosicoccus sp.]
MRVLAIDQGTSSTRGFLYDGKASNVICTREHRQLYPQPGWVEHDPEELLQHIVECIDAAGPVDAIGLDNQGESCLAWDAKTGKAISPVIVWQDRRTEKIINNLKADGAQSLTLAKAGLPLDSYFSASKLSWILENISDAKTLLRNGRLRLGTTDAFFIYRLTGIFATDITTASRTSLLNLETGEWDQALCDLFGVPVSALPEIKPTTGDYGIVEIGGHKTPLLASVVDQQASLFGHGCRYSGDAKITFGTGAFALAVTGAFAKQASDKGLLPTVAWQFEYERPVYALEGGVYCAGSALNWAKSLGLFSDFSKINSFTAEAAVTRGLVFVPALTGLGSPHWDGSAAGLWIGMSLDTTACDLVQAILEGIALRTGQVILAMSELISISDSISIDGGMSCNPYFCQFLSDVLQKQIVVASSAEQTSLGTAMLAGGGHVVDESCAKSGLHYEPVECRAASVLLFNEAVARCKGWK